MNNLRQLFRATLTITSIVALLLLLALFQVHRTTQTLTDARDSRQRALLLADELRRSSDDLTRMARLFVITQDPMWERDYQEVAAIRSGQLPRPPGYEKIYWDYRAAGIQPPGLHHQGSGTNTSLDDRMRHAGFTAEEFAKLEESEHQSSDLIKLETTAINMAKGLLDDDSGQFTRRGEPDLEQARALLHGKEYHQSKIKIMQPIDEFLVMLDERTQGLVEDALQASQRWYKLTVLCAILMLAATIASLLYAQAWINSRLGAEPHELVRSVQTLAQGNLTVELNNTSRNNQSVMAMLKNMAGDYTRIVAQVRSSAEQIASASGQIAVGNQDLSTRTEQQASALQQTSATMEELSVTVRSNADSARHTQTLAREASDVAQQGDSVVREIIDTIQDISTSGQRIGDIIGVIDGIAFQTNILALNAAVEAARAGEHGRGFAVVASEVRTLAQRSAEAAREIKTLIEGNKQQIAEGTARVDRARNSMDQIVQSIAKLHDIIQEISSASAEQSLGIEQVSSAVLDLDRNTQQNAALVEESTAAAQSLNMQSQQLVRAVAVFRLA